MIRRSTLSILVVFILLLAGTWFWQRQQRKTAESITPTPTQQQTLLSPDAKINLLHISDRQSQQMVEIQRNAQGEWQLNWPESKQTDAAAVDTAVTQLVSLQVLATLDQTSSYTATGLVSPTYTILVKLDSGKQMVYSVGVFTPTGTGRYVLSSDGKLYVVDKNGLDQVLSILVHPPIPPTPIPTVPATSETSPMGGTPAPASTQAPEITATP
jgi:hypothetical protein